MKFLVGNQLPVELARWIVSKGRHVCHVIDVGLATASDHDDFEYAPAAKRILISKDEDFLHTLRSATAAFLWVRLGNCRSALLLEAFERAWTLLLTRIGAGERIVEIR